MTIDEAHEWAKLVTEVVTSVLNRQKPTRLVALEFTKILLVSGEHTGALELAKDAWDCAEAYRGEGIQRTYFKGRHD